MSIRKSELIPIVPPETHPYMESLYGLTGLALEATADEVLTAAHSRWESAAGVGDRVEVAELLLGRRIDGQEAHTLPADFSEHIFNGGRFDDLLRVLSEVADAEQR